MNFKDILHKFRTESFTEREKGTKFERLMRSWLLTDPRYNELEKVWLWEEFPGRKDFGGTDTGIDLVAARSRTKSLSRLPVLPNVYGFPPQTIGEATQRKPSATKTHLFHGLGWLT